MLKMEEYRGRKLFKYWFSVCSWHREPDKHCPRCIVGHYQWKPVHWVSSTAYRLAPKAWRRWANRKRK